MSEAPWDVRPEPALLVLLPEPVSRVPVLPQPEPTSPGQALRPVSPSAQLHSWRLAARVGPRLQA